MHDGKKLILPSNKVNEFKPRSENDEAFKKYAEKWLKIVDTDMKGKFVDEQFAHDQALYGNKN
ncbi:MAG: hypothetical protein IPK55_13535 [Streptococcus sp.]|nr:hypothetical protein [Streptococcus sp.]